MSSSFGLPSLPARVHFVGVGGIGMSGLARILHAWGYSVSGTDAFPSQLIDQLASEGIQVQIGHDATDLALEADLIVATAALRQTNPELIAASRANIPVVKRAELLGMLMNARTGIAVAGSHGKSSTSGMLVTAMTYLGRKPSYAIGAIVASTGTNAAPGEGDEMIVEADEYDYSFLWLKPHIAIINNIDFDHPDLFPDQETYDRAFVHFASGLVDGAALIVNGDDHGVVRVLPALKSDSHNVTTFGWESSNDWVIADTTVTSPAGESVQLNLQVPGRHNIGNATAALVAMSAAGVPVQEAANALAQYRGVARRFEIKAEVGGVTIVDDYAHHPEEIAQTIAAARMRYSNRRLVVAFQPHTYSRTKALSHAFAVSLSAADIALVLDIYPARETDSLGVSASTILDQILSARALHAGKPGEAAVLLSELARSGDVVLTLGAGDITLVGPMLAELLEARPQI